MMVSLYDIINNNDQAYNNYDKNTKLKTTFSCYLSPADRLPPPHVNTTL